MNILIESIGKMHLAKTILRIRVLSLAVLGCLFLASPRTVWGATYYMPDDFPSLRAAFAGMSGGDILIIRDGTYTGDENIINNAHMPPRGTPNKWTYIKAEHPGKAIFGNPDASTRFFDIDTHANVYTIFEGLVWLGGAGVMSNHTNFIKFLKCGAGSNIVNTAGTATFHIFHSSYALCEDCYAWGGGRYAFLAYGSDHIIFRRCVGRIDAVNTDHGGKKEPIGGIGIYWSSNCEVQNCIIIDSDTKDFWNYESLVGAFTEPNQGGANNYFRGCIALNDDMPFQMVHTAYSNSHKINIIGWDILSGSLIRGTNSVFDHITLGNVRPFITYAGIHVYEGNGSITNSILTNISVPEGTLESIISDYNSFYNNTRNYHNVTPGDHDITNINPLANSLKYLPRIEPNSDLSGKASDGGDLGATVMKRIGISGSLWGEPGYNVTTNEPLWPWPNEDIIKANMRTYNHPQISSKRGFCADGTGLYGGPITLTSYIWEYLGHPCPADICNYSGGGQNNPPVANAGPDQTVTDQDGNGNEQITLDGSASSDPDGSITSYVWKENGQQIATGETANITLPIGSHVITLVVTDDKNAKAKDTVQITVNAFQDNTPPVISSVQVNNISAQGAIITWITDEPSSSKAEYGLSSAYGREVVDASLVTSHTLSLSGLEPATTYHFKVSSTDSNGNMAESSDFTFTTSEQGTVEMHTLQDFEDGVLWQPGGNQDPTGNGRGWAFLDAGPNAKLEIDNIGANGTHRSLKITFGSDNPQIYFRSDDKTRDHMPEATGANRMSFYIRFPEGFPIQQLPYRYDTWQLGTFIHDPNNWNDLHAATSESDHGIHHYYHRLTIEQVGNGWVKYIINTHPDQANYSGSTVPPDRGSEYFDNFGRFYFHFGPEAGGPDPGRPFTIWIDEIKFYHDDGSVGGQVHDGGQDDAGFDGKFIPDTNSGTTTLPPPSTITATADNSIDLSWSSVSGAVGYNVYRSTTSGSGYVKINGSSPVTGTSYVDQNTTPGTTYYYVVTSVDSAGKESAYSKEAHATEPGGNQSPTLTSITAAPNPANNPHKKITFTVTASDSDGDPLSYKINFGDGTSSSSGSTVTHAYKSKGTYNVTATVSDNHGHSVSKTLQVVVNDNKPVKVTGVQAK